MEKKSQKLYHTDYNLSIAQDLRKAHYQLMTLLKEFIKLNVNTDMMKKKMSNLRKK